MIDIPKTLQQIRELSGKPDAVIVLWADGSGRVEVIAGSDEIVFEWDKWCDGKALTNWIDDLKSEMDKYTALDAIRWLEQWKPGCSIGTKNAADYIREKMRFYSNFPNL